MELFNLVDPFLSLLTNNSRLQIDKHGPGDMFSRLRFAEERIEGVVPAPNSLVGRHLPVRLDSVLQTVQLPAGIADLDSGLANVDADTFPLSKD